FKRPTLSSDPERRAASGAWGRAARRTGERESVDLDRRALAGFDETDVEIGDQRLHLQRAFCRRHHQELLRGGHDLADRGHGDLLREAVDSANTAWCARGAPQP